MGMFDTIYLMIKCPVCGENKMRECQTKQLESEMESYYENDYIETKHSTLNSVTTCKSDLCGKKVTIHNNYEKIDAKYFKVKIFLKDQKITGEYEIIN